MATNKNELLLEAQKGLSILSVDLRASSIRTSDSFSSNTVEQFGEVTVLSKKDILMMKNFHGEDEKPGFLSLEYVFGRRVVQGNHDSEDDSVPEDAEVLLEIEATFSANYLIDKANIPSEEAILTFVEQNGLFHVWPYWREYVQSTCLRIGVPPIPIEMKPGAVSTEGLEQQGRVDLPTS